MLTQLIDAFLPRQRAATVQSYGHPASGIIGWMAGHDDTSTGEQITEDVALKYAAFWCGVRVIAEILASLPCILYERQGDNKRRATEDSRYWLVHDNPNEEMDAYHFFEVSTAHQVIYGNSYAAIVRDGMNVAQSLELRLPETMTVKRDDAGTLIYSCSNPKAEFEYQDMLHGVAFSHDGVNGYSLVRKAAQSLGIGIAGDKFVGSTLRNGGVPSGVLKHPLKLTKPAREELRREWDEIHSGAGKASRLAIMHGGMEYQTISMNAEDAQLIEQRKFTVVEIARWLRLPLYILADLENSGVRANIEQQSLDLITYSLMPWVKRWEGALKMKLLRREERQGKFFEFLLDSLLRADTFNRFQSHAIARQWGWESVNDILKMENRNTIGPDGDVYLQPLNMGPAGQPPVQQLPTSLVDEYKRTAAEAIRETIEVGKQMKVCLQTGICDTQQAFATFGQQLEETLSCQRETFSGIKRDIHEMGTKTQVRRPDMSIVTTAMLSESLNVLLQIESSEAVKSARAQARDVTKNFLKRMEAFYEGHHTRTERAFIKHVEAAGREAPLAYTLACEHCKRSFNDLVECADGDMAGLVDRVTAATELWKLDRREAESREFHERIYHTNGT